VRKVPSLHGGSRSISPTKRATPIQSRLLISYAGASGTSGYRWGTCRDISKSIKENLTLAELLASKYLFIINDAPYGNERPYNPCAWLITLSNAIGLRCASFFSVMVCSVLSRARKRPTVSIILSAWSNPLPAAEEWQPEVHAVTPAGSGKQTSPKM
jgi:hypothetical protein